jgi:hypothetical protein
VCHRPGTGRVGGATERLALLPSTVLFTLLHAGNPEFQADPRVAWVSYFVFGLVLAAATLRDGGMELALGAHAANNLFAFLLVDQVGSVGEAGAILTYLAPDPTATPRGRSSRPRRSGCWYSWRPTCSGGSGRRAGCAASRLRRSRCWRAG